MWASRELVCELLRGFYRLGWVSGTGGGICGLEAHDRLLLAPTGVHKERVLPRDLFVVDPVNGAVVERPEDPLLRPSECGSVFREVIAARGAGAVVHSHALSAVLAADTASGRRAGRVVIAGFEMLKGIRGLTNADAHAVPVIANTAREPELVGDVAAALEDEAFGAAFAILVRDHGAYVWGEDVWEAKRHAEVYHWLFEAARARGR